MIKNKKFKKIAREIYENMSKLTEEYDNLDDEDFNNTCELSFDEMTSNVLSWVKEME